jgi:hypothetical protein
LSTLSFCSMRCVLPVVPVSSAVIRLSAPHPQRREQT